MKNAKRVISLLIAIITIFSVISVPAFAASSWPSLSSSRYCEMVVPGDVSVYRDTSLKTRGTSSPAKSYNAYAEKNDKVYIYKITNSYTQLSYPTSSGRRIGYVKTSTLFGVTGPMEVITSKAKVTTYTSASTASKSGNTAIGDTVYKLGTTNSGFVLVMYTATSGSRAMKAAFVSKTDYERIKGSSSNTTVASTPKVTIIGGQSDKPKNGAFVRIRYAANGRYLDVPAEGATKNGTQLQIWDSASSNTNQYFQLIDTGKGWQILSLHSGKVVEVRDSSHKNCAQVAQWDKHNSACARWDIIQNSDGTVSFKNRESGLYLNVYGGGNAGNGTKLIQYHNDGTVAMKFYINNVSTNGYQTQATKISGNTVKSEKNISLTSWRPLNGLTQTMLQQDDSLEAIVSNVPVALDAANFVVSWASNSQEVTRIHVTQGSNKKMTIQYGSSIETNLSGKKTSLSSLLVQRYYNFSPTIVFSSSTKADECIRNWFGISGSGQYSMDLSFGKVPLGEYGYYLLIENGTVYQVPIINANSTYKVYRKLNGKTSYMFDAAQILRNAKLQLADDAAAVVMRQLVKNGFIK